VRSTPDESIDEIIPIGRIIKNKNPEPAEGSGLERYAFSLTPSQVYRAAQSAGCAGSQCGGFQFNFISHGGYYITLEIIFTSFIREYLDYVESSSMVVGDLSPRQLA